MTLSAAQLSQFALGALLIVLLPGPNSLLVMTTAARAGRSAGWRAAAGVFVGDSVLMLCAVAGAGTLLSAGSAVFRVIATVGALYLAWLAFGLFKRGVELAQLARAQRQQSSTVSEPEPTAATMADARHSPFRRSLATSLLNPKAILFFAAFFLQFINPHDAHMWTNFAALAVVMQLISIVYLTTVIFVSARVSKRLSSRNGWAATAHFAAALAFFAFALKLALSS